MGAVLSLAGIALGGLVSVTSLTACESDAVGVDACRRVEEARCKRAPACGVSLTSPPHEGSPGSDVDACIRYYRDACLHGLVRTKEPTSTEIDACVARIETGTCEATVTPSLTNECAWLGTELNDAESDVAVGTDTSTQDTGAADASNDVPIDATGDVSGD